MDPVGVGEGDQLALAPVTAPVAGLATSDLSGSFALDGAAGRTVSIASSASPLANSSGKRLRVELRASRTGSGFDLAGGVTAEAGAAPGLYTGDVTVIVNYN